jgi:hypothetical protein
MAHRPPASVTVTVGVARATVRLAEAVLPVPPFVEITAPFVLIAQIV